MSVLAGFIERPRFQFLDVSSLDGSVLFENVLVHAVVPVIFHCGAIEADGSLFIIHEPLEEVHDVVQLVVFGTGEAPVLFPFHFDASSLICLMMYRITFSMSSCGRLSIRFS